MLAEAWEGNARGLGPLRLNISQYLKREKNFKIQSEENLLHWARTAQVQLCPRHWHSLAAPSNILGFISNSGCRKTNFVLGWLYYYQAIVSL